MLQPVNGIINHAHIIPKADDGSRYLGKPVYAEKHMHRIRSVIARLIICWT
ncbi:MAG: hypothetical protein ACLS70_00020 [[Clostridium] symbiosum]